MSEEGVWVVLQVNSTIILPAKQPPQPLQSIAYLLALLP